jgi:hypothetical protein
LTGFFFTPAGAVFAGKKEVDMMPNKIFLMIKDMLAFGLAPKSRKSEALRADVLKQVKHPAEFLIRG